LAVLSPLDKGADPLGKPGCSAGYFGQGWYSASMLFQEPDDNFLSSVRDAILAESGGGDSHAERYLDGLKVRGFVLGGHLGTGAAGVVFSAVDSEGRKFAIKVLPKPDGESAAAIFEREVKIGRTIDHPSMVQTLQTFELGPAQFVVMELVEGITLKTVLGKSLNPKLFFKIFEPLSEGLFVAHSKGVVHRDLKPENVMLADDQTVKILDFGMARLLPDASVTMTGTFKGTARYTAPEQISDSKRAGPACDQFALGLMMFEGLTGQSAYPSRKLPIQEIMDRAQGEPFKLHEVDSRFSEETSAVLGKMLAREPKQRFESVREAFKAFKATVQK
jgi:serine/threonine protein kinase